MVSPFQGRNNFTVIPGLINNPFREQPYLVRCNIHSTFLEDDNVLE